MNYKINENTIIIREYKGGFVINNDKLIVVNESMLMILENLESKILLKNYKVKKALEELERLNIILLQK